jgi:hypothetical protein
VIVNFQHETWYQDEKLYTMKAEEGFLCRVAFLAGFHVHRLRVSSKAGILAQLLRVGQMVVATIGSGVASCAKKTSGNFWVPCRSFPRIGIDPCRRRLVSSCGPTLRVYIHVPS